MGKRELNRITRIVESEQRKMRLAVDRQVRPIIKREFEKQRATFPALRVRFGNGTCLITWASDQSALGESAGLFGRFPYQLVALKDLCQAVAYDFPLEDLGS